MIRVGIIGAGAIGSALAKAIDKKFSKLARLAFVSDIHPEKIKALQKKLRSIRFRALGTNQLIRQSDFVIEAASQKAARDVIPKVLRRGKSILVLSVGGILEVRGLQALLKRIRGSIYVPSGAIGGIDAVLAARAGKIRRVRITTRKPLRGLLGAPYFSKKKARLKSIKKPALVFEGTAERAIRYFPQNVNVAATLSLAGIGPRKTKVRLFTSPAYRTNSHEIEIISSYGTMKFEVRNVPSRENPKTSALAVGSAIATLEKIFARLKVGT